MEEQNNTEAARVVPKRGRTKTSRAYEKPEKTDVSTRTIQMADGSTKVKYYKTRRFKNGVNKTDLIGLEKNGRMIFGVKE